MTQKFISTLSRIGVIGTVTGKWRLHNYGKEDCLTKILILNKLINKVPVQTRVAIIMYIQLYQFTKSLLRWVYYLLFIVEL